MSPPEDPRRRERRHHPRPGGDRDRHGATRRGEDRGGRTDRGRADHGRTDRGRADHGAGPATPPGPEIPADVEAAELDRAVRRELRPLSRPVADTVARHLVTAGRLLDEDPSGALAHAVAARRLASRIPAVREAVGVAAYYAGEWQTAVTELRTYHRISGRHTHLAMVADAERALGRPERAVDIYRTAPLDALAPDEAVELLIVAAGARIDLGQHDAALALLQVPQLSAGEATPAAARLRYAYADALAGAGRQQEARDWFARAVEADTDVLTGAAERLLELDGVVLPEVTDTGERLVDPYDLVVLDLDGVVYVDDAPVPGAVAAVAALRRDGVPVVFATNNASRTHQEVAALLTGMGIDATESDVLTSATVAADQLAQRLPHGEAVLVVGAPALTEAVRAAGLRPVGDAGQRPAAVVQGYGSQVGWSQLAEASVAIQAGATWVVTNTDTTLPSSRGLLPGNGALVAALRTALGREPDLVVGKPEPALFRAALARTGADRALVVGDRLDTDIDGALRAGMDSLLVLTGVDGEQAARHRPPDQRPTYVAPDLGALLRPAPAAGG